METKVEGLQENELIVSLQRMINSYMNKNQSLTINALAQRSGIPVTTLRRLVNGEQKSEIAPHSVLNLTSYIFREKKLNLLLKLIDPVVAEYLNKHFGSFIFLEETKAVYRTDLNETLADFSKYIIYKLAANHNGVDYITIVDLLGSIGHKKAQELLTDNHLFEENGKLHAKDKNFSIDFFVAAKHLPNLVSFYRPDTIAEGKNSFFSLSESLNEEAILEIKKIQRESVLKIHKIMSDPSNFGSIPYFTINLSETMDQKSKTGVTQ